jgi:glutathione S-transferase
MTARWDYPNLSKWFERVKAFPAWKATALPG